MQRGLMALVLAGAVAAAAGAGSARASGVGAETTATTTADTTTTPTTTTNATTYAPLASSSLPAGCVGAGAAAVVLPVHPVMTFGAPAAALGPSAYFTSDGAVVSFSSSSASGSTCASAAITLSSVSLFGGAVTASSVQAKAGKGTATGLEIDGAAVDATPGETVPVEGWGELTLGATAGRVTAPLEIHLLQAHDSLPAGATVAVAFAASALAVAKPRQARETHARSTSGTAAHAPSASTRKRPKRAMPDFPSTRYPFLVDGGLGPATQKNAVVSIAMKYLGVPYRWGGARPSTGFDCSGLVSYVFAQLGVSLPHYAAAQWKSPDAVWVRPTRLQPGDLVFFTGSDGTRKAPGHVGIYVGDGYLIDAPHTGAYVQVDRLSEPWFARNYVGAKRIVGASQDVRRVVPPAGPERSIAGVRLGPAPQLTLGPAASAGIAAAGARLRTASSSYAAWTGIGVGSVLVVLLAGGATYRRRRAPEAGGAGIETV
jgi:cell wall-associated NlpC family hydrolase